MWILQIYILLHEFSHLIGTLDHAYRYDGALWLAKNNATLARNNGDNYALYAMLLHNKCSEVTGLPDRPGDGYDRIEYARRVREYDTRLLPGVMKGFEGYFEGWPVDRDD